METLIVRAHTVEDAIESAGVQFCGKKLIQLMAGPYFYIEYHQLDDDEIAEPGWGVSSEKFYSMFDEDDNILAEAREYTLISNIKFMKFLYRWHGLLLIH